MIYYRGMKKCFLIICFLFLITIPFIGRGQSFDSTLKNNFFDYPQELLQSQSVARPTIIYDTSAPTVSQTTTEPYEVTKAKTPVDQLRELELFNPSNGIPVGVTEQVSVKLSPENPQAQESFTVRVDSFSTNLNQAVFTWKTNGSVVSSGRGVNTQTFTAPPSGETLNIELSITTIEGNNILKTYTISPAKVDLYYEANTYTFPFYQGKALYTHQSDIVVHAFPYINEGSSFLERSQLSYVWEVDNRVIQDKSGYGKSSFTYNSGLLSQEMKISVTVSSLGNPSVAEADIFITPKDPDVLIFEKHPLYGLMHKNIVNSFYRLTSPDVFLTSIPLFFSTNSRNNPNLNYVWNLNGKNLPSFNNVSQIAFRNSTNQEGEARIRVSIKNNRRILQSVSATGRLVFSKLADFVETAGEDFF